MTTFLRAIALLLVTSVGMGCGGSVPVRFVLERDIGVFQYRRYQKVLDVEFPVEGNPGVGHTASYVRRGSTREVAFATAFVTIYERPASLVAEVRDRLDTLGTYEVSVGELSGGRVFWLDGGEDRWALWVSGRYIVKLGAPRGEEIPEDIASEYMGIYPSDIDEHGRAKEGAASAGPSHRQAEEQSQDLGMPAHLREHAPQ